MSVRAAALALAVLCAGVAAVALGGELAGTGTGELRAAFAAVTVPSAGASLLAARRQSGATAWMFAALGLTLAVSGAAVLA
jgi:hypothetical protein